MVPYIDNLFHKRGSVREEGLSTLITKLKGDIQLKLVENNYFTILSTCENSIKKGSAVEIKSATQVIGLLALTVGPGDCANEIYSESLRILPQALKTTSQPIPILECLAIVTFARDDDFDETERSMKIIWEYMIKQFLKKDVAPVVAAIYAWSFLLAKADHCRLDKNYWKGVIPFFLELLKKKASIKDEYASYHPVIVEALALVADKGIKHKFCSETDETLYTQVLEDAGMKDVQSAVDATSNVSEDHKGHQTSLNVRGNIFTLRTWSEQKKMNYLNRYLGDGFKKHIVDNNFLQNAFKCNREEYAGPTLYVPEEKEVTSKIYVPEVRDIKNIQRLIGNSRNSIMSKGQTRHRNKLRMISQEKKAWHIQQDMD